jgi:hypothetical protein
MVKLLKCTVLVAGEEACIFVPYTGVDQLWCKTNNYQASILDWGGLNFRSSLEMSWKAQMESSVGFKIVGKAKTLLEMCLQMLQRC